MVRFPHTSLHFHWIQVFSNEILGSRPNELKRVRSVDVSSVQKLLLDIYPEADFGENVAPEGCPYSAVSAYISVAFMLLHLVST